MFLSIHGYKKFPWWMALVAVCILFLASCGGSLSSGANSSRSGGSVAAPAVNNGSSNFHQAASTSQSQGQQTLNIPANAYLVKTLKVSLQVNDTRTVANELQHWISSTDNRAISTATDYEQVGDNLYTIDLAYSIQSSVYPQVYAYLRDYSSQHGGHLSGFTESVQDVTNEYIDTQSRLKSLHTEQGRLLDLMSHAQALGDVVTIEQKLTDVEGQIETYEGRMKNLNNQVSFYTIQITLQPLSVANPSNPQAPWSIGQVFQQAFNASITFAQVLITFLIWVLAFAWYGVPILALVWLIKRLKSRLPAVQAMMAGPQKTSVK